MQNGSEVAAQEPPAKKARTEVGYIFLGFLLACAVAGSPGYRTCHMAVHSSAVQAEVPPSQGLP